MIIGSPMHRAFSRWRMNRGPDLDIDVEGIERGQAWQSSGSRDE
jgi:hypothetical protein